MLILDTNDKLRLVTSAAASIDSVASFVDRDGATITPNSQKTAIVTATTTDVVGSPSAGVRNVKSLIVRNKHATVSCDVTAILLDNATIYEMAKFTLRPGEGFQFIEGVGFFPLYAPQSPMLRTVKLGADQGNSTTTATEVTGLSTLTGVGTYDFRYRLITTTSVTTTTPKFSVNHDGTTTEFNYWIYSVSATITAADGLIDGDVSLTTGGLFNVNAARAKSTTALTAFVQHDTTTQVMYVIEGICVVTVDGNIELWHGSETAALTTVKAGSSLVLIRTGD